MPTSRPAFAQQVLADEWLDALAEQAPALVFEARAANTLRAYRADWADFVDWCRLAGLRCLPADGATVGLYLTDLSSRRKVSTLTRRLSAIGQAHQLAGYESPTSAAAVRELLAHLRRSSCSLSQTKRPILVDDLRAILDHVPGTLLGIRDRALLLVGFTGAFRRSELVGLDVEDLAEAPCGLKVRVQRNKGDAPGVGRTVSIPAGSVAQTCPVRSLQAWRTAAEISSGAVFRVVDRHGNVLPKRLSGEAVALVVKRYVERLGYDASGFAGHSLRAGLATSAAAAGKSERAIMNQTGHKNVQLVRRCIREANVFAENAVQGLGL